MQQINKTVPDQAMTGIIKGRDCQVMNLLTILVFCVLGILIGLAIEGYTYWELGHSARSRPSRIGNHIHP
ncbi:hypothetical protein FC85_GL002452 [Lentilactobacillus diolivorans DSM 14421]|uniref:Uncharacterized protein n=1 Tax=Lentilactobacillus diolivorans DSM 14421 TaxID=1423739 RepID=A0A0R1SIL6_9LACO|nr:hypothetical protein FC85_GL002452 [Lentilactobacillus diolivorans DSM 14421]